MLREEGLERAEGHAALDRDGEVVGDVVDDGVEGAGVEGEVVVGGGVAEADGGAAALRRDGEAGAVGGA